MRDAIRPHHVLMACDAMTGQDAVLQARAFMKDVDLTGFVLTKLDGDSRGGAALSITHETGTAHLLRRHRRAAEGPGALLSRPDGLADPRAWATCCRLIEKAEKELDQDKAREAAEKMADGPVHAGRLPRRRCARCKKLGSMQDLLAMLPGIPGAKQQLKDLQVDEREFARTEAII